MKNKYIRDLEIYVFKSNDKLNDKIERLNKNIFYTQVSILIVFPFVIIDFFMDTL